MADVADDGNTDAVDSEWSLLMELANAPIIEVTGIVDASGAGGGKSGAEDEWTLLFSLVAWRVPGGLIQTKELVVRRKVNDDELKTWMSRIRPDGIIRIRARIREEKVFGAPQALLEELVEAETRDVELQNCLAELKKPVACDDDVLGFLTFDRRSKCYSTKTRFNEASVELNLELDDSGNLQPSLKTAHKLWSESVHWDQRVRDCIVRDLLPLKNESWRDEDELVMSREAFEARMTLASITVFPDSSSDVCYNDGDLFWGHWIVASGHIVDGMKSATIHG